MNLSLLLILMAQPAAEPSAQIMGVLGGPKAATSAWVHYDQGLDRAPRVRIRWHHAAGWLPRVSIDHQKNQLFAVISPEGGPRPASAELWQFDLETKNKRRWATALVPRQKALFSRFGPLFVTQADTVKRLWLGRHQIGEFDADLCWPLRVHDDQAHILLIARGRSRLVEMALPSGEVEFITDWGRDPVRDFSFRSDHLSYERQVAAKIFRIETLDLKATKTRTLAQFNLPWLAPLSFEGGVLFSRSPSAVVGRLAIWQNGQIREGPDLGRGAPIPLVAAGAQVVIRRQSESGQDFFLWDSRKDQLHPINTQGLLLDSIVVLKGVGR